MYPYNFRPSRKSLNYQEVFVVMPFEGMYDPIFNDLIIPAVKKANIILGFSGSLELQAYRSKDDIRTTSGWINVLEHLFPAQIVLGVLTDNNPNVFYELGIAHATQPITRQILIANKDYEVKFDTKDLIYLPYQDDLTKSIEPLAVKISDAVKWFKIEEDRTVKEAKRLIGVVELEVMMTQNCKPSFPMHTSEKGREEYEQELLTRIGSEHTHLKGCFDRHVNATQNLLRIGLLEFFSESKKEGNQVIIYYGFRWTNLGNDILFSMGLILDEERERRRPNQGNNIQLP